MGEITPYNRIENFLAKGSGADVAPYNRLERILAGEDLEPTNRLEYFAKEAASGGGNPNSVQTITGTLAEPWGDFDKAEELSAAIENGNASAKLTLDISVLQAGLDTIRAWLYAGVIDDQYAAFFTSAAQFDSEGITLGFEACIFFSFDGNVRSSYLEAQIGADYSDLSAYASLIPTTLTIIWHPLPT